MPPALELPMGAQVRFRTAASDWVRGVLVSAHRGSISLVPEEAPPAEPPAEPPADDEQTARVPERVEPVQGPAS